ncbi:MAG: MoaD/ThiS family protein [Pirellulales bacterium]|nr:MoaD/ThiS family protein [Pirellulales bacterium]
MASVSIPLLFRDLTGGARQAEVSGGTLADVIAALETIHPGIEGRIRKGHEISSSVTLTVDGRIAARGLATPVAADSQISILPAFGGG